MSGGGKKDTASQEPRKGTEEKSDNESSDHPRLRTLMDDDFDEDDHDEDNAGDADSDDEDAAIPYYTI